MSPESIEDPDRADARSDLYSLAASGYYLLTGKPVFDAANVIEVIRHHLDTPPVPPSQRASRPMSKDLERVLLACLAKLPADRPASAAALAEELTRCVPLEPWTGVDAQRWWQNLDGKPAAALATTQMMNLAATAVPDERAGTISLCRPAFVVV